MNNKSTLMKNTLSIAFGSVLMRAMGLYLQIYTASHIKADVIGVFGLISSAYMIFVTIAISGIRFCTTRIVAQEVSLGNNYPKKLMKSAFRYGLFFGVLSGVCLFCMSGFIAKIWIGDNSALIPLRLLSLALPFIPISAAIEGYFTAKQKALRLVIVQFFDQAVKILLVIAGFTLFLKKGVNPCIILCASTIVSEIIYTCVLLILFLFEVWGKEGKSNSGIIHITKTALPLAVSAYMRTGLSSIGHMIIPKGLCRAGMSKGGAFVTYGIIHQMALPVVMFPSAILSALGEVLIGRLTYSQSLKQRIGISYIVNRAMRIGAIFSFGVAGYMFFHSALLGEMIYKNSEAGFYIRIMAPLVPIIYCDCVTDGCLKGLGQQLWCMIYNILEAALNIFLLLVLLPRLAIAGYIVAMYVKEIFNFVLSLRRLYKITTVEIRIAPLLCILLSSIAAKIISAIVTSSQSLLLLSIIYFSLYGVLIYITNSITRDDLKWVLNVCSEA